MTVFPEIDSGNLEWGLKMPISSKFPGGKDRALRNAALASAFILDQTLHSDNFPNLSSSTNHIC